jgi:hypothetical protein
MAPLPNPDNMPKKNMSDVPMVLVVTSVLPNCKKPSAQWNVLFVALPLQLVQLV